MKKVAIVLLATTLLVVAAATVVNAGAAGPRHLHEIVIEDEFHHLGDDPDAESVSWETTVWLKWSKLKYARSAHVEFYLMGSGDQMDSVVVNGRWFALPKSEGVNEFRLPYVGKTLISIPVGLLHWGENTIGFEAMAFGAGGDNTHDDFEFGEVVLLLST